MKKFSKVGLAAVLLAGALALAGTAFGAGLYTNGLPVAGGSQYPYTLPLTGNEQIPADTMLPNGLNPATQAITTGQLAGYISGITDTWTNGLIGGDFAANLWQRGTTSASITTSLLYTADRWWGLSGAGTAFTVSRQTAAQADGIGASARVQRTAAQTGVLPICVGQVMTTANSWKFAGQRAELSFYAKAGSTFSAAGSRISATIATGTGTDGTAASFSTGGWTGYANAVVSTVTLNTGWVRYNVVASIPSTATQVGVKLCYTPVGTAGANDFFEFANAQLAVNPNAVAWLGGTGTNQISALAFEHRTRPVEILLQQAYYFQVDESAVISPVATCANSTTSLALCYLGFPTTMRATPVFTGDGGFTTGFAANTTTAMTAVSACTSLAVSTAVASTAANPNGVLLACGSSAAFGAAGTTSFLYSNNGSGKIRASAEL